MHVNEIIKQVCVCVPRDVCNPKHLWRPRWLWYCVPFATEGNTNIVSEYNLTGCTIFQCTRPILTTGYKNLDEIAEFNNIITTTEFLAKDIFNKITDKLKKDYSNDFKKLHKIKIILTESNLAWATYEDEIKNNL